MTGRCAVSDEPKRLHIDSVASRKGPVGIALSLDDSIGTSVKEVFMDPRKVLFAILEAEEDTNETSRTMSGYAELGKTEDVARLCRRSGGPLKTPHQSSPPRPATFSLVSCPRAISNGTGSGCDN